MKLHTELAGRDLRFDGVSIVESKDVSALLIQGVSPSKIRLKHFDAEIEQFNLLVAEADRIRLNEVEPIKIDMVWSIPTEYQNLNLEEVISEAFIDRLPKLSYTQAQTEAAFARIQAELLEIQRRGLQQFTSTIIYVLSVFREKGIVWGVGRGSSCASYALFVLGLHAVDSIKYDVPMEEFFHD